MKQFLAYILFAVVIAVGLIGIAGFTCWGCFSSYQSEWWTFGVSSLMGICCILAIEYSAIAIAPWRRYLIIFVPSTLIMVSILTGIWFNSWFPRVGPPRRGDLFQLVSLVPLIITSIAFAPSLMRIYRGIHLSATSRPSWPEQRSVRELIHFAISLSVAFVLPIATKRWIGHLPTETELLVLYSILCIGFGSIILWPTLIILTKFNWLIFYVFSTIVLVGGWLTISILLIVNNSWALTITQISLISSTMLVGPLLIVLFLIAMRLIGFRLSIPPRTFKTYNSPADAPVHPLDAA